jgi:hypothetical protein
LAKLSRLACDTWSIADVTSILLGCVSTKRSERAIAKDLYCSPLWLRRRAYAESSGHAWLIVSALHGLVDPEELLDPYDLALTTLSAADRRAWGERVVRGLAERFKDLNGAVFEVHAGSHYRTAIAAPLQREGGAITAPLANLSLGRQLAWYAAAEHSPRRRHCQPEEVHAAVDALGLGAHRVRADSWPSTLSGLDQCGLYSWWTDSAGAADLSSGLDHQLPAGRIYAGLTGATKWPSGKTGKMTLRRRIGGNHLRGTIDSSTFRRTLAAALRERLRLEFAAPGRLVIESELALSGWIREHLEVAVHPFDDRDALASLERAVLSALDPPLNLDGMPPSALRSQLTRLRTELVSRDAGARGG